MASGQFQLRVLTPDGPVFDGEVDSCTAPGFLGEFGVLPGHAAYVTAMRPGVLSFVHEGEERAWVLGAGFAEVGTDAVVLLTESCEAVDDIDHQQAVEAMAAAEQVMVETLPTDHEYLDARAEHLVQIARVQASDR